MGDVAYSQCYKWKNVFLAFKQSSKLIIFSVFTHNIYLLCVFLTQFTAIRNNFVKNNDWWMLYNGLAVNLLNNLSWKYPSSIRRRGSLLSWLPGAVIWWREAILTTTSTGSKANSVHRYVNQHLVLKVFYDSMSIYLKWLLSFYSAFLKLQSM